MLFWFSSGTVGFPTDQKAFDKKFFTLRKNPADQKAIVRKFPPTKRLSSEIPADCLKATETESPKKMKHAICWTKSQTLGVYA